MPTHEEQRELDEDDEAAADDRALRVLAAMRDDSSRCTMSWSAPCDAMARKAPPISPAQIVCGRSSPVYESMHLQLARGAAPGR